MDVGTGFYVEKVCLMDTLTRISPNSLQDVKSASEFYEGKIKDLSGNIAELESIIQNKSSSLRAVEEGKALTHEWMPHSFSNCVPVVLKQKILAQPQQPSS